MNQNLPLIKNANVEGKSVLVRVDLDVPEYETPRVESAVQMVNFLKEKGAAKIKAIAHRGEVSVVDRLNVEHPEALWWDGLRDDAREKENNEEYAKELAEGFEVYVNESFAVSHRTHTSIVKLPELMRNRGNEVYLGLRFERELVELDKVRGEQKLGKLLVVGGVKIDDKWKLAVEMGVNFEKVLVGGRIPVVLDNNLVLEDNFVLGKLRQDGLDIDDETIERFKGELNKARMVVLAGPLGKFEDEGARKGTKEVFTAAAGVEGYRLAGGGNTEEALASLGLMKDMSWVSVGGGAMLYFLANGTLPGLMALVP